MLSNAKQVMNDAVIATTSVAMSLQESLIL